MNGRKMQNKDKDKDKMCQNVTKTCQNDNKKTMKKQHKLEEQN